MSNILEQYNLTFRNGYRDGRNYKQCIAPDATNDADIAYHLSNIDDEGYVDLVLEATDKALAGGIFQKEHSFNDTSVDFTTTTVTIHDVYTIPINDYKAIIVEWSKFLKQPPLHRQKV